jgi:hypothetical protein
VANIILLTHPDPSMNLIRAALWHDVTERWAGDTPAPAKYQINPELGRVLAETEDQIARTIGLRVDLTQEERQWLAAADVAELILWAREQYLMGNAYSLALIYNGQERLMKMETGPSEKIIEMLVNTPWGRHQDTFLSEEVDDDERKQ